MNTAKRWWFAWKCIFTPCWPWQTQGKRSHTHTHTSHAIFLGSVLFASCLCIAPCLCNAPCFCVFHGISLLTCFCILHQMRGNGLQAAIYTHFKMLIVLTLSRGVLGSSFQRGLLLWQKKAPLLPTLHCRNWDCSIGSDLHPKPWIAAFVLGTGWDATGLWEIVA